MGALSAAVWADGQILSARYELLSRGHAEKLIPMIAEVCEEAGLDVTACGRIGVTIGPGTFTGQRVGLAAARAMRLGTNLQIVGVTTLKAIAAGVDDAAEDDFIVSVVDARRGEIYLQVFTRNLEEVSKPLVMAMSDAAAEVKALAATCLLVGTGAAIMAPALTQIGVPFRMSDASEQPDARHIARLAASEDATVSQAPSPLYLRAPDAKLPKSK